MGERKRGEYKDKSKGNTGREREEPKRREEAKMQLTKETRAKERGGQGGETSRRRHRRPRLRGGEREAAAAGRTKMPNMHIEQRASCGEEL